ncbi:MAG: HlyC/CorC family transporter [Candidatus Eisenbacteria bacterium]|nr:HlyC/CorC family transporter [Candidatus Eisenbacteria bacterium]
MIPDSPSAPLTDASAPWGLLWAYVLFSLLFSFLCSIAEAVLLSITPSYIEDLAVRRPRLAGLVKRLKQEDVDRSLAAILTLNTVAHTVGAVGAGAQATILFGSAWVGLFSAVLTLAILFLTEIIPKTIGAVYWSSLVRPTAFFVHGLTLALYPIVRITELITKSISRGKQLHVFSREEFIAMARVGEATGHLHAKESRIIRNLFRLGSLRTADIMTPRTVISAIPETAKVSEALELVAGSPFSRLLLYRNNLDEVTGFALKQDILMQKAAGRDEERLSSLKRNILAVPGSMSLSTLLDNFLEHRQHIAIVIDEHGGTRGLVTFEDLVETLMGLEITDETDSVVDMRALARKQWLERAKALGIDEEIIEEP